MIFLTNIVMLLVVQNSNNIDHSLYNKIKDNKLTPAACNKFLYVKLGIKKAAIRLTNVIEKGRILPLA